MVWLLEDPSHPFILQECCGEAALEGALSQPSQSTMEQSLLGESSAPALPSFCWLHQLTVFAQLKEGLTQAPTALAAFCRRKAGDSPRPGGSPASRCVGCWRNASPESPPGGCGPAGRAAAPPPTPARRHQLELPHGSKAALSSCKGRPAQIHLLHKPSFSRNSEFSIARVSENLILYRHWGELAFKPC